MTKPIKWGLMATVAGVLLLMLVVWGVQRYQDRLERETHAPERLQQRLMAVQAGDASLQAEDLEEAGLRAQEEARIRRLLAQDLSQTPHPEPDQAVALLTPGAELVRGAQGISEGALEQFRDKQLNKFREDGLHILTAGGTAGFFSAIVPGWVASGERGSQLVSQPIKQ